MNSFDVQYNREPGVYYYPTEGEMPVHALALSTWEELERSLAELPPLIGYVVTPELITSPVPLEEVSDMVQEVEARTARTIELSRLHPDATILLGTPTIDETGTMRNSLVVISNGERVGYIDKRGVTWEEETRVFSRSPRNQAPLQAGYAALICSDIITAAVKDRSSAKAKISRHDLLSPEARTLIVSSCWAVPRYKELFALESDEERYRSALERSVSGLFTAYPELREVIMVDRSIANSSVLSYTGHFKRRLKQ